MNNTATQLNIYDLYRNINHKKEKKNVSYNQVLYKIHDRVKRTAEKEKYKLIYEIPEVIFGLPSYDLNLCMAYIIKQLRGNGFLVKYYFPKILYISWDPTEIKDYKKQKNNVKQNFRNLRDNKSHDTKELNDPRNYYTPNNNQQSLNNNNQQSLNNNNYNQQQLTSPLVTQPNNSIFKPMLNYDPNNIPTYNYFAYSTLNNNLVNEKFYIDNKQNDFNQSKKTQKNINPPEHFKKLNIQNNDESQEQKINNHYQKDILDYYKNDDDEENPFKNTIKKYNSKGKYVLDLT